MILRSAHQAAADHAWQEALEGFRALDAFSDVLFFASHILEAIDARQRAYAAYERAGRSAEAGAAALSASLLHHARGDTSVASGWFARAQRLLTDVPENS